MSEGKRGREGWGDFRFWIADFRLGGSAFAGKLRRDRSAFAQKLGTSLGSFVPTSRRDRGWRCESAKVGKCEGGKVEKSQSA